MRHLINTIGIIILTSILGAAIGYAFAPFNHFYLLYINLPLIFIILTKQKNPLYRFLLAWLFTISYILSHCAWMGQADFYKALPTVSAIAYSIGVVEYLGIYLALGLFIATSLRIPNVAKVFIFAICWVSAEFITNGIPELQFPWMIIGYIWATKLAVIQNTAYWGIYGLSFFTVLSATSTALLFLNKGKQRNIITFFIIQLLFISIIIFGVLRLHNASPITNTDIKIRLVNTNVYIINPTLEQRLTGLKQLMDLTTAGLSKDTNIIIWPETTIHDRTIDFNHPEKYPFFDKIKRLTSSQQYLITGTNRLLGQNQYANTIATLQQGRVLAYYDKSLLIPFIETTPYKKILRAKRLYDTAAKEQAREIIPGKGFTVQSIGNIPAFSTMICFEAFFFPQYQKNGLHPQWILVSANDGWYRNTTGIEQVFYVSRMRAIEEGLPMVRVANHGISAIIDGYGRILAELQPTKPGVLDGYIPKPNPKPTFYSQYGYLGLLLLLSIASLVAFVLAYRFREELKD